MMALGLKADIDKYEEQCRRGTYSRPIVLVNSVEVLIKLPRSPMKLLGNQIKCFGLLIVD